MLTKQEQTIICSCFVLALKAYVKYPLYLRNKKHHEKTIIDVRMLKCAYRNECIWG